MQTYKREDIFNSDETYKKKLKVVTFVDPAISLKQEADNTAIVTIGVDETNNNIFILDVFAAKVEPNDIIDNLFRIVKRYEPEQV